MAVNYYVIATTMEQFYRKRVFLPNKRKDSFRGEGRLSKDTRAYSATLQDALDGMQSIVEIKFRVSSK